MAPGLEAIDWAAAWLAPYRATGQAVAQQVLEQGAPVHQALQCPSAPVQFAPQHDLPEGTAYEQHIFDTGRVPTRENLHDFFNGLVWRQFPLAKRRLNELQAGAIAAHGIGAVRGSLRDAITVFDENGALLDAPDPIWQALQAREWTRLFGNLRPLWHEARLLLFGHALLEKLVAPRKPIVAHVYRVQCAMDSIANSDAWLAQQIEPANWSTKPFTPLPVLGVPGWWPANEDPQFYADPQVFRPPRAVSDKAQ